MKKQKEKEWKDISMKLQKEYLNKIIKGLENIANQIEYSYYESPATPHYDLIELTNDLKKFKEIVLEEKK